MRNANKKLKLSNPCEQYYSAEINPLLLKTYTPFQFELSRNKDRCQHRSRQKYELEPQKHKSV